MKYNKRKIVFQTFVLIIIIVFFNLIIYPNVRKFKESSLKVSGFINLNNLENAFDKSKDILNNLEDSIFKDELFVIYDKKGNVLLKNHKVNLNLNLLNFFKKTRRKLFSGAIQGTITYQESSQKFLVFYKRNLETGNIFVIIKLINNFWDTVLVNILSLFLFGLLSYSEIFFVNIFKLKRKKKKEKKSLTLESYITENEFLMVVVTDSNGIIKCSSKVLRNKLKYDSNILKDKDIRILLNKKTSNFFERLINFQHLEEELISSDKTVFSVKMNIAPINFDNKERYMIYFEDITPILVQNKIISADKEKLLAIINLNETLQKFREVNVIAKIVIEETKKIIDCESGMFFSYKESFLRPLYFSDKSIKNIHEIKLSFDDGLTGYAADSRKGIIFNHADGKVITAVIPGTEDDDTEENLLSVPLISHNQLMGVITISREVNFKFTENDLNFMKIIANLVSNILYYLYSIKEINDSLSKYTQLLNNSFLGIFILIDRKIGFTNNTFCNFLGYSSESLVGRDISDFIHPDDRDKYVMEITDMLLNDSFGVSKIRFITSEQKIMTAEIRFGFINWEGKKTISCSLMDISEKIELTEQILELQKMESIGLMASSISHDFKNVLSGVIGASELLKLRTKDNENLPLIDTILKSSNRGKKLAEQILKYSRHNGAEITLFDVNKSVIEITELIQNTLPKNVKMTRELYPDPLPFEGDSTKIVQCIMNLCVNARDAMEKTGGYLEVKTNVISDQEYLSKMSKSQVPDGEYIEVSVKDTGEGISDKIKETIFKPFFTTKKNGKGTGLGLSTTIKIIKEYNGFISLESKVGKGTTFYIFLPKSSKEIVEEKEVSTPGNKANKQKIKNIIMIDDDESLLEIGKEIFEELGGNVFSFSSPLKALDEFEKLDIDIAIVDYDMPEIGGEEVIQKILEYNPNIKTYLATGFVDDSKLKGLINKGMTGFLAKPYGISDIRKIMQN